MNAYELAEGLEQFSDLGGKFFGECANILRQQADRIAELEKSHIELERGIVADFNQRQSAEPFIWLKQDFDGEWIEVHPNKGIPLYTTSQIKELSDEEIYQEMIKCIDSPDDGHEFRYKDFARAILKKASEK
jgi:hypothetical protein